MKKLSEFTGKDATNLIGKVLLSISAILRNKKCAECYRRNDIAGMLGNALVEVPDQIVNLLAALNEKKPEEYEYTAASLMTDAFAMFSDPALVVLFGSQS